MEQDIFNNIISYGALGSVCAYFMLKDWTMTKKINDTLASVDKSFSLLVQMVGRGDK